MISKTSPISIVIVVSLFGCDIIIKAKIDKPQTNPNILAGVRYLQNSLSLSSN